MEPPRTRAKGPARNAQQDATSEASEPVHEGQLVATAHTTTRLEALTDGVFAIVMTLMVFDIAVPQGSPDLLARDLARLWPKFLLYGVSFLQLGIYWMGHRNQFNFIRREDHTLRWICLLFLALVALIPFSTQLLGNFRGERLALGIYAANYVALGLMLALHWLHAVRAGLVDPDIPSGVISVGFRRCLTAPALYGLAFLASGFSPRASLTLYALVPLVYLFPWLMDRLWLLPSRR